ncbi:MAG: asparagine synthase C-terminal domain-containing protein [Gammaproteobacteria bacterium]
MLRYLVIAWDPSDTASARQAQHLVRRGGASVSMWRAAIETAGLIALVKCGSDEGPVQSFPVGCGVILGSLYSNPGMRADDRVPAPARLTPEDAQRVISSHGRELVTHWWGDYIAVFREWSSSAIHVLRGPAATIACLYARRERLHLYFSDMETGAELADRSFTVHWQALARALIGPQWPGDTHLKEVREVIPGSCEKVFEGRTNAKQLWCPAQISQEPLTRDFEDAARTLRTVTRACVHARAAAFPEIVMSLSGGLDSSITLACLADAPSRPHVTALTQFAEHTDSDERYFARLAAARAGCEIAEQSRDLIPDLRNAIYTQRLQLSPGLRMPEVDRIELDFARSIGARAVFYGHGGDEIFNRNALIHYCSDYVLARGFRRELLGLLMHAAFTEGVTVWEVLARAVGGALRPDRFNVMALLSRDIDRCTLLRPEVVAELIAAPQPLAPYFGTGKDIPPGRRWQIGLLSARRTFSSPFDRAQDAVRISPFLSQPLLELCLRIPTWYQMKGRRDRALARRAFVNDLPPEIEARRDKGGAESVAGRILARNAPFLRELLLDGIVARSGLIDCVRLEAALSDSPTSADVTSVPLFDLAGAEIWARTWHAPSRAIDQNRQRIESP